MLENARRKARAGIELAAGEGLVLGVDTEVVLDGRVLGKARDATEARERLEALSGRTHEVLSGVVLIARSDTPSVESALPGSAKSTLDADASPSAPDARIRERAGVARSLVIFRELSPGLLAGYLRSGEWRDRAGAYAVQGLGSALVERVEGDLANVIGLPLSLLLELAPELLDAAGDSAS